MILPSPVFTKPSGSLHFSVDSKFVFIETREKTVVMNSTKYKYKNKYKNQDTAREASNRGKQTRNPYLPSTLQLVRGSSSAFRTQNG